MKKILLSVLTIGIVAALGTAATSAYFSDTETSRGNILRAGAIDLKVGNESYYNGEFMPEGASSTTWSLRDIDGTSRAFLRFNDLKPGDWGEDTIELQVNSNPAWLCAYANITSSSDVTCTDSEFEDDSNCAPDQLDNGELVRDVNFVFWADDGDNVLEQDELPVLMEGAAQDALGGKVWTLADSSHNIWSGIENDAVEAGESRYIGKAWCFGDLTIDALPEGGDLNPLNGSGVICNGANVNNASQTDMFEGDIAFYAVQERHNPSFLCSSWNPGGQEPEWIDVVGAVNDTAASDTEGEFSMRHVGNPAPSGYSHDYQWGSEMLCNPNSAAVTFTGTINVNPMPVGSVALLGLVDKGLLETGSTGYQSGAYLYVYRKTDSTVIIGTSDGNDNGELVQNGITYGLDDGSFNIVLTIHNGKVGVTVDGGAPNIGDYGEVKTLNQVGEYAGDEFATGAYVGWDNYNSYMPYNLSISGCGL